MAIKPILFSGPMMRALLAGRKTQTRRLLKRPTWAQEHGWPARVMDEQGLDMRLQWFAKDTGCLADLPIPQPGDLLWVRERFAISGIGWGKKPKDAEGGKVHYFADPDNGWFHYWGSGHPSIHMPRWASRLTLRVTDVRVQRLQEISDADAQAEGMTFPEGMEYGCDPIEAFRSLWDSLNADRAPWDDNPWVAAYTFTVHECNVDQMEAAA